MEIKEIQDRLDKGLLGISFSNLSQINTLTKEFGLGFCDNTKFGQVYHKRNEYVNIMSFQKLSPSLHFVGWFDSFSACGTDTEKEDIFIKHNQNKPRYDLICPFAHEDLAKVLTFGSDKYEDNNWTKGDINTYIAALQRHLVDIKKAVNSNNLELLIDEDSGLQHGAALMANSMFIHHFVNQKLKEKN